MSATESPSAGGSRRPSAVRVAAARRASASMQLPPPRLPAGSKRSKEQRTTDTFRRARSRLQAILVWRTGRSLGSLHTCFTLCAGLRKDAGLYP